MQLVIVPVLQVQTSFFLVCFPNILVYTMPKARDLCSEEVQEIVSLRGVESADSI